MKYKFCSLILIGCVLVMSFVISAKPHQYKRVHRHLEKSTKVTCTHNGDVFCTHLPIIDIKTKNGDMPQAKIVSPVTGKRTNNNEFIEANISVYESIDKNNHLTDVAKVISDAHVRYRGNSSRSFDKKGILLNLINEEGEKNKVSLLGMVADSKWALHGPYLDKTLMRNYMWYNIAGEVMEYSPNVGFCEVFLNNEYIGIYVLSEKIEYNEEGRVNITKANPKSKSTSYILKIDKGDIDKKKIIETFSKYSFNISGEIGAGGIVEIVYPSKNILTEKHKDYIIEDISEFEKGLYSFDYKHNKFGYKDFIDVESFIDYFIINEFTCNYDALSLSTYLYKDIRGKVEMVIWDFNSSCDYYRTSMTEPQRFESQKKFWYKMLFKDEYFVKNVISRYKYLRKNILSDEYLINYIDEVANYLGGAVDRNYEKWGYSFGPEYDMLMPSERNARNYEESLEQMKKFIVERGKFMDKNIETLYQYSHSSVNKKFNNK